jgi:glycosyltransferase involved in cell wall biosynthesis
VIGDAGLIVPEGDEEALRGALLSLIHDRQLYDGLAYAGRQRVLEHFTQQHIAGETLRVYESIL